MPRKAGIGMETMELDRISEETFAIFKAATSGITSSTGILGKDLSDLISLVPVNTPFTDGLARTGPDQGSDVAIWEALLNVNNTQPDPSVALDAAGLLALNSLMKVSAPYEVLAMGYTVTRDSVARARGYADAKARGVFSAISQWKIGQERKAYGGQQFALQRPVAPTVTDSATGGSIAASTATYVGVAARTGAGYFYCNGTGTPGQGNSQGNTGNVTTSTVAAATHAVSASTTSVAGAVCYDWFQAASSGGTYWYYGTTTIPSITMTSTITANNTPPTATMPKLSATTPSFNAAADNGSANPNEFNGLLATCTADYTTAGGPIIQHGSGTASGSVIQDAAGGQFTVSGGGISQLDALNVAMFNSIELGPHEYMVNAQESNSLGKLILNNPGAVTYLTMNDPEGRANIVAGGKVGSYVNRLTGDQVPIRLYPHTAPGTLIARRNTVPFPNGDVGNVFEIRCLDDMYDYVYGSNRSSGGPRDDGEVRSLSTFINKAPVAQAVLQSIAPTP
jgi:hypothetical protein